jgi:hypothetical protein
MKTSTASNSSLIRFAFAITLLALAGLVGGWCFSDQSLVGMGALMTAFALASWMGAARNR